MDKLLNCVQAFDRLLDVQYRIIIGRKGTSTELRIGFTKWDLHHLMGLGKLKDMRVARQDRRQVFDQIAAGRITYDQISKSRYIALIEDRFEPLAHIEQLLDDNRLVFRYNQTLNQFSVIEADYILSTPHNSTDTYIFVAQDQETGLYFCRSFFPKSGRDYTEGQPRYTMLYKEKIKISTGETVVQYDRLTPKG